MIYRVAATEGNSLAQQRQAVADLLQDLLGSSATLGHKTNGAPYIVGRSELWVSVSHCKRAVAVAVSESAAVGIDIECRRRIAPGLIQRVCTTEEQQAILRSDDATQAFLQLWTCKEAALKCAGTGIRGFSSLLHALTDERYTVAPIHCHITDVYAAVATEKQFTP